MADLGDIQSSGSTKLVGSDSSGAEQTPVQSTSNGGLHINLRDESGSEAGVSGNPISTNSKSEGDNNTAIPTTSTLIAGSDGTSLRPLAVDTQGRLITTALTGFGAEFTFGEVVTASLTAAPVNKTTYTEQTTNAQRSIASSSASDTAAGTGARTVTIFYLAADGSGPFTETVTLNGTSYVNTVATNICFINDIRVVTAGTGGANVGTITLKASTGGGGATICTIAPGDNQTLLCHQYIPTGKTVNITGLSCGHKGTTVGSGALFVIRARAIGSTVERQVSDFVRLYGQSSTIQRGYISPISIAGPAFFRVVVTPETASSSTYRAAVDFFEP